MSNGNNGKTPPGASFPHKSGNGNGGGNDRIPELPEIALPAKIGRGNIVQNLSVLPVLLNGYNISLVEAIPKVYQHELKFFATDNKGKEKDLSRGPRNDVSNILRHEVLYEIYMLMLNLYKQDFHITSNNDIHRFVYDCGINFYSADKLMNKGEEKRFLIDVTQLSQKSRDYLSQRFQKIEGVLLHTEEIDLKSTSAISENVLERDRSVLQFLEILSSQFLYNKESYYVFRQKMFEKKSRIPIRNDTRIIKSGMQKNIRFIGDSQDKAHPFLQIDPKKSAFYDNIHVMKYLAEMFHCRNEQDLEHRLSEPRLQRQVARELKGIVVKTTHMTNNIYFSIHNLTEKGPDQIFFETRDCRQQSVKEYLEEKYHFRLRFPSLPCVVEKRVTKVDGKNQSKESYYPMEVLEIFDGQRITRQKMNPALTEEMIRNCQINPAKYVNESEDQRSKAFLSSGAPHFKAFGVKIEANMRAAVGEVLFPPAIQYGNEVVNLPIKDREGKDDVAWQINRKRFVKGAEVRIWVAALFQRGISPSVCNEFVQQLVQNARQFGMNLPNPAAYEELDSTEGEFVRQKMKLYKDKNVQYILFFTKDKQDPVHNTMKLLEVEFSIPTQHVSSQTIQKVQSGRGAQLVFGNILQKMNLKLGGINHDIVTAQAFQIRNNRRDNIVKDSWLKQTRMFIGIDMSHAGPQSLFERQAQIPSSEPTIVGMAYTVGHPVNIRGTYWCQKPRLTIIENLADKVSTAILNFHSQTNGFPTHLIVYRSGISEGEYAKVITQEESYFKEAFELVAKSNPSFRKPTLTIIVVQRNSNYRVVPQHIEERAPAVKQNCPSGTVVDREVMHPTQTEFLLTAQKAIQGTAHPCKCTVVFDDSAQRISLEELEYVTYALCFGHGIVTSPVSVPAPLYSAGDLAKRGRNNWKEHNFGSDSASVMSGESGGRFRNAAGDPDFFINLSETLKPSINNTKFWA